MSIDREIQRLKLDPDAFQTLASLLSQSASAEWTDWERDFLERASSEHFSNPPSTRQCEKLLELRDSLRVYNSVQGFSIWLLIENTWRARFELNEDDEEFVSSLYGSKSAEIGIRPLRRLLTCARKVDVIQKYIHLD